MNYQDAIRKINKLLGLYKFNSYKIKENGNEIITEGDLAVGEPIYIINKEVQYKYCTIWKNFCRKYWYNFLL